MTPPGRIRVLPEETVNRVAAGEVVERPAAALKELLENSIDAGATRLSVDLEGAGRRLISVADDGSGMGHDALLLALERHATSKIVTVDDLTRVATYGFRGEALPSIAAVSRLRIETRERGAPEGTRLEADGGRILRVLPCGCPEGTRIEVRDLFHSVPARLKFLRSEATELAHCLQIASRLALTRPALGLTLRHGPRELLRLAPAADPGARLRDFLGREFFAGLLPVRGAREAIAVSGFVSRPGSGRAGADYQQLFVNARPVRDPLLAQGVREAALEFGRQDPAATSFYLWLSLPPELVDVNVHPTKREVRFGDPRAVRDVVVAAVREALRADRAAAVPTHTFQASPAIAPPAAERAGEPAGEAAYQVGAPAQPQQPALPLPIASAAASPVPATTETLQLFGTYLVFAGPEGLVLVDQHAAHERVLFERILARSGPSGSQQLLEPLLLELTAAEEQVGAALQPLLATVGIAIEPFGPRSWRVLALPPELAPGEAEAFVRDVLARALQEDGPGDPAGARREAAALLACHAAIRARRRLAPLEVSALLRDLAGCDNPGACPHGRPATISIDRAEIERRFKRT